MTNKGESAETRLRNEIASRTSVGFLWQRKRFDIGITGTAPEFDDPEVWAIFARSAFTLRREDANLKRAFQSFKLNPRDPRDWRELLNVLVGVFGPAAFAVRKKRGAKRKWTGERRNQLLHAVEEIKRNASGRILDEEACRDLIEASDSPPHIRSSKVTALVRQLGFARNRRANRALAGGLQNVMPTPSIGTRGRIRGKKTRRDNFDL